MKKRPDLKPGDLFYFYDVDGERVTFVLLKWSESVAVSTCGNHVHYRCIQGIKRKKEKPEIKAEVGMRNWWINEKMIRERGMTSINASWECWFEKPDGAVIRTTPPKEPEGWICVREIIP